MSFAFLPLFTGDYLRDTQHLSCSEHGIFLKLLMHCWDQKGPAPLDERKLCGIVNARSSDEIEALRRILGEFFTRMEDGWYNHRMQGEIERSDAISNARSAAGRKGYQAKAKQVPSKSQTLAKQVPLTPTPTTTPIPEPSPEKQTSGSACRASDAYTPPDCPHLEILALWQEVLPALHQHDPKRWRDARADHLRARWRETAVEKKWESKERGLRYFRNLFAFVGRSQFLTGHTTPQPGRRPFAVDLEWVVNRANWDKIHEAKYHEEAST